MISYGPRRRGAGPITSIQQALEDRRLGRREASEAACRAIIETEPDHAQALQLLGALLLEAGRAREAEDVLRQSLARDDASADVLHNLGLARAIQGDFHGAAGLFARAIVQRPRYVSAYYNLALALQVDGEADKAAAVYQRVIALEPGHAPAWNNLGILHHGKGELDEARDAYQRALAANPEVETTRANLASIFRSLGDPARAKALFEEALEHDPRDPLAHYILAQLDYIQGDVGHAIEKLAVALDELIARRGWLAHAAAGSRWILHYPIEEYREALATAVELTSAAGIEVCLLCGTLLGAIRDGDFMAHDKDIDLGMDASVTPAMLDAALSKDPRFRRYAGLEDDNVLPCYFFKRIPIDFFRLYREAGELWYGLRWRGHLVQWRHSDFALRDFTFLGVQTRVPEDSERHLREVFGEGWRTPDPYFAAWASPNIVGGLPPVCRCLAYANIFKAAWSGGAVRALRYCEQALALDPGDARISRLRELLISHASQLSAPSPGACLQMPDDPFDEAT